MLFNRTPSPKCELNWTKFMVNIFLYIPCEIYKAGEVFVNDHIENNMYAIEFENRKVR